MYAYYAIREIKRRRIRSSINMLSYVIAIAFLIVGGNTKVLRMMTEIGNGYGPSV